MSDSSLNSTTQADGGFGFDIVKKLDGTLGRAGVIHTPHGDIETPAYIPVGTKATVKALTPEQIIGTGAQAVLANTYHLYLEPGHERLAALGGMQKFMAWHGPTFTDSGGFQAFSLGAALGRNITKFVRGQDLTLLPEETETGRKVRGSSSVKPAKVQEDGVLFYSHLDGSPHFFTPERSIDIQRAIGADIIFAFDECTSPTEPVAYQRRSLDRTHRWAKQCLRHHHANGAQSLQGNHQALYAVVQGARFEELRRESAKVLGDMALDDGTQYDGFGIGGSFAKEDMAAAVKWVNEELPEGKPRHLLGIGEVEDLFMGVEQGCDTFDCVAATRIARTGQAYTRDGKVNLTNARFRDDTGPIDSECDCYTCRTFSRAYLAHLFRSDEMLGATLASLHNTHFIVNLVKRMRQGIIDGDFYDFKRHFLTRFLAANKA
jgi:queuine tRNA-ribosyltransferase